MQIKMIHSLKKSCEITPCAECGNGIFDQESLGTAYRNKHFRLGNLYLNYNQFLQVVGSLAQPMSLTDRLTSVP